MSDLGRVILRAALGTILLGHGTQKLFGWFEGPGLKGVHGFMEALGLKPGVVWGTMAAVSETGGGFFTLLGFLNPLGPLMASGAMTMAILRGHKGKPFWNNKGGYEFPMMNLAAALALAMMGPGKYSLDRALGTEMPRYLTPLVWMSTMGLITVALQKPEAMQTVMDKASTVMPQIANVVRQGDLEIETRPRQEEPVPQSTS